MEKTNNYEQVNNEIFTMEFIFQIVCYFVNGTLKIVSQKTGISVPNVYIEVLPSFDKFKNNDSQKEVSYDILDACTAFMENPEWIYSGFSYEEIKKDLFEYNPMLVIAGIGKLAAHEAFHACQLQWLKENSKMDYLDLVKKVSKYNSDISYFDNVMEKGAYEWQKRSMKIQNFKDLSVILE